MRYFRATCAVAALVLTLPGLSSAQPAPATSDPAAAKPAPAADEGQPLSDDVSRGDLFALMPHAHAFNATGPFTFPHDTLWKDQKTDTGPRQNQIFGIDLSHHNLDSCLCKAISWTGLASQHVRFAYLKASQGLGYDKDFATYRTGARKLPAQSRIYVGAYHFLSSSVPADQQAAYFLKLMDGKLDAEDLPPALDLEWDVKIENGKIVNNPDGRPFDKWSATPPKEIVARVKLWLDTVAEATGRTPMLYTSREWVREGLKDETLLAELKDYPIWVADYSISGHVTEIPSTPDKRPWTLWQFTSEAQFTSGGVGKSHGVDASVFDGSESDFYKAFGLTPPDKNGPH